MAGTPLNIFISYSRTDSEFVDRLEADLKARGFQVWIDRRKLEGGQDWIDELESAIKRCQIMLARKAAEAPVPLGQGMKAARRQASYILS
jgi:hypothetical protein